MRDETYPRQDRLHSGVVCLTHGVGFVTGRLQVLIPAPVSPRRWWQTVARPGGAEIDRSAGASKSGLLDMIHAGSMPRSIGCAGVGGVRAC
jgi:hypothetical protein